MQTGSFFSSIGRANTKAVAISLSRPAFWHKIRTYPALNPWPDMLDLVKGNTRYDQYEKWYSRDVLGRLDPVKVYADLGPDAILLCWEHLAPGVWVPGPTDYWFGGCFCHRFAVARWLERANGIVVQEFSGR